jgi:hypothetical protein
VAITYHNDGTIVGYRDGLPYGRPYKSGGPVSFNAGDAVVTFGVRHLPPTGNRMLSGAIAKAQLYDRALSADQVAASAGSALQVSDSQVDAALSDSQRARVRQQAEKLKRIQKTLRSLGPRPATDQTAAWTDLARAIFTMKEFIYIR